MGRNTDKMSRQKGQNKEFGKSITCVSPPPQIIPVLAIEPLHAQVEFIITYPCGKYSGSLLPNHSLWPPGVSLEPGTGSGHPRAKLRLVPQALPCLPWSSPSPNPVASAVACGIPFLFVRGAAWSWDRSQADRIIPSCSFKSEESCSRGSGRVWVGGAYEKTDSWNWFWGGGLALRICNGPTLVLTQALLDHTLAECLKLLFLPKLSLHGAFAPYHVQDSGRQRTRPTSPAIPGL